MATMNIPDFSGASTAVEKPNANGRAAATASRPTVMANEDFAAVGALTETAPASDTASSGLNGRLQRIAQRLSSLIALLPSSLGSKTAANSLSFTHASDDPLLAIAQSTTASPVALATDHIATDSGTLVPKFAKIAASTNGDNTLVTAVSGKKIRVLAYNLISNGAVNAKFQSGAAGTDLTGLKYCPAAGNGICAPFNPLGWFETASNTLLNLNLSGAVAVGGELVYVEV